MTINLGFAVLHLTSLSFLGLGIQPPTPESGAMINDARPYIQRAPWQMAAPPSLSAPGFAVGTPRRTWTRCGKFRHRHHGLVSALLGLVVALSFTAAVAQDGAGPGERWRYRDPAAVAFDDPVLRDGMLFFGSRAPGGDYALGAFTALDAGTGDVRWRISRDAYPGSTSIRFVRAADLVLVTVATIDRDLLVAVDAVTGAERWRFIMGPRTRFDPIGAAGGLAIVAITGENLSAVARMRSDTGAIVWLRHRGDWTSPGVLGGDIVIAAQRTESSDGVTGALVAVDAASGNER